MPEAFPEAGVIGAATRRVLLAAIEAYRRFISPVLPPACRYLPTCSDYGATAIGKYGALRGSGRAFMRLLRCHPLARGGYDPVR